MNLYFAWAPSTQDAWWYARIRQSVATLKQVAVEEGIYSNSLASYPNYAITGTPINEMYGSANAARLHQIRDQVDPTRIMDLAGGFPL